MLSHKLRRYKATPAVTTDSNFKQTVLLLHGDGTNGGQNNTFIDGSTNNFTITRNGNTTQGTFSPFSVGASEWSNFFDGNGDYLRPATNAGLSFDANFTIEMWAMSTASLTQYAQLFASGSVDMGIAASRNFSNTYSVHSVGGNINSGVTSNDGLWHHIALVRNGSTITFYIDGVSKGTITSSATFDFGSSAAAYIGSRNAFDNHYNGYISNLRVVKGTAVYTANFTPPTAPLTAITNTQLLTCQSNRFIDNSSNNLTMTRTGDVSVRPFSPFAPTAAYSASTNGGSGYFDGTGDYLTLPTGQTPLILGNSDFTFESWVYRLNTNIACLFAGQTDAATVGGSSFAFYLGAVESDLYIGGGSKEVTSPTPTAGQWSHVAWVRTGGTCSSYLNGIRVGTNTTLSTSSINNGSTTYPATIGAFPNNTVPFFGYISNARLIKGSGGYDATQSTITVPTAPLTAITNTSLLCNFTNAAIIDNTGKNVLETVGNAQIDTGTKKFGTGALEFDGTGDYLITPSNVDFSFGTGNFTIEGWLNLNASNQYYPVAFAIGTGDSTASTAISLLFGDSGYSYRLALVLSGTYIDLSSSGIDQATFLNSWGHFAVVRNSTTLTVYINGNSVYSASNSTDFSSVYTLRIGGYSGFLANGYIDDLRITKGIARYTANFTPPSAAYPDNS